MKLLFFSILIFLKSSMIFAKEVHTTAKVTYKQDGTITIAVELEGEEISIVTPPTSTFELIDTGVRSPIVPSGIGWADSYLGVDGQCWPATTFDHKIGEQLVTTGTGSQVTIRQAVDLLGKQNSYPARYKDYAFNDINCGNGPANTHSWRDEDPDQCPGLVMRGRDGCSLRSPVASWWLRI